MSIEILSIRQVKAARALLAWSQHDLADASGISYPTIARLEKDDGVLGGRAATAASIRNAFETAGVEFIAENGGGAGVRLVRETPQDRYIGPDWTLYERNRNGKRTYLARKLQEESGITLPDLQTPESEDDDEVCEWVRNEDWPGKQ